MQPVSRSTRRASALLSVPRFRWPTFPVRVSDAGVLVRLPFASQWCRLPNRARARQQSCAHRRSRFGPGRPNGRGRVATRHCRSQFVVSCDTTPSVDSLGTIRLERGPARDANRCEAGSGALPNHTHVPARSGSSEVADAPRPYPSRGGKRTRAGSQEMRRPRQNVPSGGNEDRGYFATRSRSAIETPPRK